MSIPSVNVVDTTAMSILGLLMRDGRAAQVVKQGHLQKVVEYARKKKKQIFLFIVVNVGILFARIANGNHQFVVAAYIHTNVKREEK